MPMPRPPGTIYLGNAGPIPLYVHWSAAFMVLLAFSAGGDVPTSIAVLLALVVGIVLHEFGHGFTALLFRARNISVTLWAIGGVCASEREREGRHWAEVAILVAGPAVSFALAAVAYAALDLIHDRWPQVLQQGDGLTMWGVILLMLYWVNLSLGIFNCLPIFPLDGGQIAYQVQRGCGVRHNTAAVVGRILALAGAAGGLGFAYWYFGRLSPYNIVLVGFLVMMSFQALRPR